MMVKKILRSCYCEREICIILQRASTEIYFCMGEGNIIKHNKFLIWIAILLGSLGSFIVVTMHSRQFPELATEVNNCLKCDDR